MENEGMYLVLEIQEPQTNISTKRKLEKRTQLCDQLASATALLPSALLRLRSHDPLAMVAVPFFVLRRKFL